MVTASANLVHSCAGLLSMTGRDCREGFRFLCRAIIPFAFQAAGGITGKDLNKRTSFVSSPCGEEHKRDNGKPSLLRHVESILEEVSALANTGLTWIVLSFKYLFVAIPVETGGSTGSGRFRVRGCAGSCAIRLCQRPERSWGPWIKLKTGIY